jgi:hypothetical protein
LFNVLIKLSLFSIKDFLFARFNNISIKVFLPNKQNIIQNISSINISDSTFTIQTQVLKEIININKLIILDKSKGVKCDKTINDILKPTSGGNKTHKNPMKGGNYNNSSISTSSLC